MTRQLILLTAAAVGLPSVASAHFLWLVPNAESGRVEVYFGESADPDDPALLDKLKGLEIQQRLPNGKVVKTEAVRKDDWLAVTPKNLRGTFALSHRYGTVTRGEETFLLNYAAKTYTGAPDSWKEFEKSVAQLDVVPRREAERLVFEVRFDGKPVEGAQVVVDTPELDRIEGTTDAKGTFAVPVKDEGTFAARVRHVENRAGKQGEKEYASIRHYETVTLALGKTKSPTEKPEKTAVKTSSLPDLPRGITSFGAATVGNHVYVYGGNTGSAHEYYREGQSDEFLVLDLQKPKEWKKLGAVPRRQGLAVVPHGPYVYRVGGFEALNEEGGERDLASTSDFARFDTRNGKWEQLADLPEPRSSHDAVVIGGMQEDGGPTRKTALYDPAKKSWSEGPELIGKEEMGGFGASAIRLGDALYVSTYEGSVQRLDDGKWVEVATLEHPRFFHRMVPTSDGKLVVVGGASMTTGKIVETETIDPTTAERAEK